MHKLTGSFLILLLHWIAVTDAVYASSVVLVAEDGGYDSSTVQTVRTIASTELRVHGVAVTDDPRYHSTVPLTEEVLQGVAGLGAERLFVVRFGRLGEKVMISIEEFRAPDSTPLFAATLMAESIEEADTVVPRLIRSVLERVPPEKTAGIASVTAQESKPFRKKPGEGLFVIGMCVSPLGGSLGWSYEAQTWRLGVLFQGAEDDPPYFGLEGAWVPLEGQISPYAGAGLGIVWPAGEGDGSEGEGNGKLGAKVDLGFEFLRLHRVRLLVGGSAVIPLTSMVNTDDVNPELWIRLGL